MSHLHNFVGGPNMQIIKSIIYSGIIKTLGEMPDIVYFNGCCLALFVPRQCDLVQQLFTSMSRFLEF